jgi:hypothetical protein
MSLQKLGKKDSPPVIANGALVTVLVTKASAEKDPPPGLDLRKLAEIAEAAKVKSEA